MRQVSRSALGAVAAAALTVTGAGATGATATAAPAAADGRGWIEGTVRDDAGNPVAGALVNALNAREVPETGVLPDVTDRRTTTDAAGHFRVRQAAGGSLVQICQAWPDYPTACRETVSGVDFVITYVGGSGVTDSWVLQRGLLPATAADTDLGTVTVRPEARIHGRIAGAAGQQVRVMRLNDTMAFRTFADSDGRYVFDGLVPGRYYIAAGGEGSLPWRSADLSVGAHEDAVVDGTLRPGTTVVGTLSTHGEPVPRTDVLVSRRGHGVVAATTTSGRGRFRVPGLAAGTYRVGILYDGSPYLPHATSFTTAAGVRTVRADVAVVRGASLTVHLLDGGRPARAATDELRDATGRPVQAARNDGSGTATYTGLRRGTYTVVAAGRHGYARKAVEVTRLGDYTVDRLRTARAYLTLTGTTAPGAVVEATTGDFCPPGGTARYGAFHEIQQADDRGRYTLDGLVPGTYMLGSDGWPQNYVPRCRSGVGIHRDRTVDLPLAVGSTATGRLVYADSGTPVITPLSYELTYPEASTANPTDEHPARDRTRAATGAFRIEGLRAGSALGALADHAGDGINDPRFQVVFPYQDGTPYWLETAVAPLQVGRAVALDLGDVPVVLRP